jgi:transcriptional regulator with XRE-family HTH domain
MRQNSPARADRARDAEASGPTTRLGSYLRRLRERYGYTLRKVEERANILGESIDNSQLSRFEKGKAVPSFDKLRALARIFNIPVQSFSDVLDLEEYEPFKPSDGNYQELVSTGAGLISRGEVGRAYVYYERAQEIAVNSPLGPKRDEAIADSRWRMATTLKRLGKLSMAEHELREILKERKRLAPRTRMRTLLQLSYLYRELGDLLLSSILAKEALAISRELQDPSTEAGVLNTMGNIAHAEDDFIAAIKSYRQCLRLIQSIGGSREMEAIVSVNLGGCMVQSGQPEEGMDMLRRALNDARKNGYRRAVALALTRIGEAHRQHGDTKLAITSFSESDIVAASGNNCFHDILFLNAYRRWQIARSDENGTREKIAFGRLRHLRSLLQRRFPEVDAFDAHIDRDRRRYEIVE